MLLSPNDNRNLRKYIIDFILTITKWKKKGLFKQSNFRKLGHFN